MFEGQLWSPARAARVRVPASTSNLGPGFDLVGLAVTLYLDVELRRGESREPTLDLTDGSVAQWPPLADNLLLRGFRRGCELSGAAETRATLIPRSAIPLSRGLGSSGAAVVAGLLLGASVGPREVERATLLAHAIELEGHPDNATPALLGGCVLALAVANEAPAVVRVSPHPSLAFAVAWPAVPLETKFARSILPRTVPFADAVENPRRLALLLEGLRTGDARLLGLGAEDRLHVPYRLPHIPGGITALDAARAAGAWLATVSGSGSALFAIASHDAIAEVANAMKLALHAAAPPASAHVVELAHDAPRVEQI